MRGSLQICSRRHWTGERRLSHRLLRQANTPKDGSDKEVVSKKFRRLKAVQI